MKRESGDVWKRTMKYKRKCRMKVSRYDDVQYKSCEGELGRERGKGEQKGAGSAATTGCH